MKKKLKFYFEIFLLIDEIIVNKFLLFMNKKWIQKENFSLVLVIATDLSSKATQAFSELSGLILTTDIIFSVY
jgi:hypothetical protein